MSPSFIMIDLETFGSTPGCAIAAIGAVHATADGCITDRFYCVVSRQDGARIGLHEDEATLAWWAKQSEDAQRVLQQSSNGIVAMTVADALDALNRFVGRAGTPDVYGNGSDFDNAILAAAARAAGTALAWPFWKNRCYRTLKARAPFVQIERVGTHHDALDDATSQAKHLGRINRVLALDGDTIVHANAFLTQMADRYRERTCRRLLGLRLHTMGRWQAMQCALATFDAAFEMTGVSFGDPEYAWNRDHAHELVDEELQHWES